MAHGSRNARLHSPPPWSTDTDQGADKGPLLQRPGGTSHLARQSPMLHQPWEIRDDRHLDRPTPRSNGAAGRGGSETRNSSPGKKGSSRAGHMDRGNVQGPQRIPTPTRKLVAGLEPQGGFSLLDCKTLRGRSQSQTAGKRRLRRLRYAWHLRMEQSGQMHKMWRMRIRMGYATGSLLVRQRPDNMGNDTHRQCMLVAQTQGSRGDHTGGRHAIPVGPHRGLWPSPS